jgi:hypothetical protein
MRCCTYQAWWFQDVQKKNSKERYDLSPPTFWLKVNAWLSGSFLANKYSIQVHNKFLKIDQMDMVVNFLIFNIIILEYQTFTHLSNLSNLSQNLY